MVFSSSIFLLFFLPAVFCINLLLQRRVNLSNVFLMLASLFFYAWGESYRVLLMLGVIGISWWLGKRISKSNGNRRKWLLGLGTGCDLLLLGYFKYTGFLVKTINLAAGRELLSVPDLALPIGISFFTFQAISYLVDVYRGETKASHSFIQVALYISFFPQLIAGPIVKYREISQQIEQRRMTADGVALGFRRFIYGLSKKVLISNVLGLCADRVFGMEQFALDPGCAWMGALAYAFQIYYDFSGYSDMAIGLGKMFGFDIPENFRLPYLSASITEFWRRWHISLGSWFREYVYIPMGGNRKGQVRTCCHLFIVFLLTGLWHGADYSFLVWGIYYGVLIVLERIVLRSVLERHSFLGVCYTFLLVTLGWVLFRAESIPYALQMLRTMILPWSLETVPVPVWSYLDRKTVWMLAAAVIGAGPLQLVMPVSWHHHWKGSVPEVTWLILLLVFCLAAIAGDTYNPFIYFRF